jgi:hypothetical protein
MRLLRTWCRMVSASEHQLQRSYRSALRGLSTYVKLPRVGELHPDGPEALCAL